MNNDDRRYLKALGKMTPTIEVFKEMVQILANLQTKTDQILKNALTQG